MEKAQRITAQKSVLIEAVDNVKFSLIASHLAQTSGAALQTAFKCPLAPPQRVTMKCLQKFLATQQIMTLQTFYLVEMADKNAADLLLHNSSQRGNTFVPSSSRNFQFDSGKAQCLV